jgi:hypothetical protein
LKPIASATQRRRLLAVIVTIAGCCGSAHVVSAASEQGVSNRHVRLGVLGDPGRFKQQTGQKSSTRLIIVGWNQGNSAAYFEQLFSTMLDEPMVGLSTGSEGAPEILSPGAIARGEGDQLLLALNAAIAQWHKTVFVRPLAEMNGHWNSYSAFSANGSARDANHSTSAFKDAFARIYLIVHGTRGINGRLRALGMPPFSGDLTPAPNAAIVWNPQGYGSPDLPGNRAAAYYPGDRYVDVVADDLYDIHGKAEWDSAEALYNAHPHKPFAFGEWGLWGIDDPAFVRRMAAFITSHSRIVLATYYSGRPGSTFDLQSKPRSLAAYRAAIAPLSR